MSLITPILIAHLCPNKHGSAVPSGGQTVQNIPEREVLPKGRKYDSRSTAAADKGSVKHQTQLRKSFTNFSDWWKNGTKFEIMQ